MTRNRELPGWLEAEVLEGITGLLLLRLDGAPAADLADATANVWLAAVRSRNRDWNRERDVSGMKQAFAHLYASCDRWPSPKQLLDALPAAAPASGLLEAPDLTDEQKQRGREMLARLGEAMCGPKLPTPTFSRRVDIDRYIDEQVAKATPANRK